MRRNLPYLAVVTILATLLPIGARGQVPQYVPGAPPAAQVPEFGYYVPVLVPNGSASSANFSLHVGDDVEEPQSPPMPALDTEHVGSLNCDCADCMARRGRGCAIGCNCLTCRHDRLFQRSFASVEYMQWYNKGIALPPLITSNVQGIPPQAQAGVLGFANTRVLVGDSEIDDNRQVAGRVSFGFWLDDDCNRAVTARLYDVEGGTAEFVRSSNGASVLAVPFFNSDQAVNAEDALLVAYPGLSSGTVLVRADNDMIGGEVLGRSVIDSGCDYRWDIVGGYQFAQIDSLLEIGSVINAGAAVFAFGDRFDVENEYHGFTAGLLTERYADCWTFSALGKIGFGNMRQTVTIEGVNSVTAGGTVVTPGGLFAQPTNIGLFERDRFVWSPEVNLKASCAVTKQLSISVGYTFLYFDHVAFAGDQIDRSVNATQLNGGALVGPARPDFEFRDQGFWIQSVDVGLSYRY